MAKDPKSGNGSESREDLVVGAISRMPENIAIMKMENDNIVSMAKSIPRDHKSIIKEITDQLEAYPSFAAVAVYAKPVGKDPVTGQMKIARGLSIRAAEAIAEAYRYNRVQATVAPNPDDQDSVQVSALFVDYQNGRIWQDAGILSKWYKKKSGAMEKHPDDRFFNVVVKAEVSRRIREVILRSVPPGLRQELLEMAQRRIAQLLTPEKINEIVKTFAERKVTQEMLEKYIGRTIAAGWKEEDRLNLQGLYVAIEDGETTIEEAFSEDKAPPAAKGEAQVSSLLAPAQAVPAKAVEPQPQQPQPAATAPTPSAPAEVRKPPLVDMDAAPGGEEEDRKNVLNLIDVTLHDADLWPEGKIPTRNIQSLLERAFSTKMWTEVGKLPYDALKEGLEQIKSDIAFYKKQKADKEAAAKK